MNTKTKLILGALALGVSAFVVSAQEGSGQPPAGEHPGRQQGQGGQRPMVPPLMTALDANHDGVIDAKEIDNAPAALRKLDKNGDGKLTPDEIRPPRREGQGGQGAPGAPGSQPPSSKPPGA
jgi:hypothetical protein